MPRVESSIIIQSPLEKVIAVAQNNEQFPEFMSDVESLAVKERSPDGSRVVSDWVGIVPKFGTKIRWTEEDLWDRDKGTCTFRQLSGDYKQFEGVWTFTPEGEMQTRFSSVLDYDIEIPLVGALIQTIIRKTMQTNVESTLQAIKQRCETGA